MGIWIRSQEKIGLINCSDINVGTNCGSICVWGSISDLTEDIGTILGTYHTEAEAIAVLDMIQERIDMTRPESVMAQGKAFQMPAAGFCEKGAD